jgi:hypothetical protein
MRKRRAHYLDHQAMAAASPDDLKLIREIDRRIKKGSLRRKLIALGYDGELLDRLHRLLEEPATK